MQIEQFVTAGKFRLDGGEWDVENNVYVLAATPGADAEVYIVDPAHDAAEVYRRVGDRRVRGVILTHAHNDHCELAPEVAAHYGVDVYLHPGDQELWEESNGGAPYQPLAHGQTLHLGEEEITVLHTPGHSPGCVVLSVPSEATLLSGDTLFNGGPGATGRKYSDFDTIINSLREVVFALPADYRVLPGHGDSTTISAESARLDEYIARGY
ncbi:MBL fold metallo-hydrolase [Corynebacterium lizhenjunii]|uniref:MBL fold metallo-hydrolase n=1 Tax=Corynebacterium lizhenjunii TaxID=2709394 RepID=UPI0013EA4BC6|nr:MBL fold metallo-hydrolase [Corynebacterium lizhenjunii]